jgi:hypothetical protein
MKRGSEPHQTRTEAHMTNDPYIDATRRVSQVIQALIGWIFWDPGAERRYEALGVPAKLGYFGSRAAPLAPAGDDAVIAAFSTIKPAVIRAGLAAVRNNTTFDAIWHARDEAIVEGLRSYLTSAQIDAVAALDDLLWRVVAACPLEGRTLFGAHLRMGRPADLLLSAWHGASNEREWRGDTHMALLVSYGLNAIEASILHSAWMGYPHDWIGKSRAWNDDETRDGFASLRDRGLAEPASDAVNDAGIALRQEIEDRTDELCSVHWRTLSLNEIEQIIDTLKPLAPILLARVDETAGPLYMPAARRALD